METADRVARRAGILYLIMSVLMVFSYLYVPQHFLDFDHAAVTAHKILADQLLYRVTIATSLVAQLLFVFVVMGLYELFREVDRPLARLMVALVCVGIAAELVTIAGRMAPLVFLSGDGDLSAFSQSQLEGMSVLCLRLGGNLGRMLTAIWGLWLFPFGLLTLRSGYFPKVLGILLMAAGVGYVGICLTFIVFPAQLGPVSTVLSPLYFGELPIIFWLAIRGAKTARRPA